MAGRRILVAGATGFIGSRLIARLSSTGATVHGLARSAGAENDPSVHWWAANLADHHVVEEVLGAIDPEIVFHLGGQVSGVPSPDLVRPMIRNNLLSTVNVLESARQLGSERVLVTASLLEPEPDETGPVPGSPYAASKWASSSYARMYHQLWDVPLVVLRPFMVYGPGQADPHKLIPYVIGSLQRGEAPEVSSGDNQFDWVYVDDVVEALLAGALTEGIEGRTFDVGSGDLASVREVVLRLQELVNPDVQPAFGAAADRPARIQRVADVDETHRVLGWRARTTLHEGLERTAVWFARSAPRKEGVR